MKIVLTALLALLSRLAYANETIITSRSVGNLHAEWTMEPGQQEAKKNVLLRLADSLIRQQGYADQPVLLRITPTVRWENRPAYALSYCPFWYQPVLQEHPEQAIGLMLVMQREDFDVQAVLRLLLYGLTHRQYVQTHQTEHLEVDDLHANVVPGVRPDDPPMLPLRLVSRILRTPNDTVAQLLRQRLFHQARYRRSAWFTRPDSTQPPPLDSLTYYYQDNAVHFFRRSATASVRSPRAAPPTGPDVLVVDNVREVVGRRADGYFVFVSDSSFYYLPPGLRGAIGPVRLPRHLYGFYTVENVGRVHAYRHARRPAEWLELRLIGPTLSTAQVSFEPGQYRPITQVDQTTAARQPKRPAGLGFAGLWLLLAAVGGGALWWQGRRVRG